jgi:hypothetical protein
MRLDKMTPVKDGKQPKLKPSEFGKNLNPEFLEPPLKLFGQKNVKS